MCLGAEQGVVGDSHQGQRSASSEAGRRATACLGRPPPRQSHFPKVAVTHGAPEPRGLCYSTGKRDNGVVFDISVWGRSGESSGVSVEPLSMHVKFGNRSTSLTLSDFFI